ncbi:MAG: hypothetical protein K1X55_00690 [Chitinophagales bacterium]|nr:hypothetical protein [Chitinophagales bacterium]
MEEDFNNEEQLKINDLAQEHLENISKWAKFIGIPTLSFFSLFVVLFIAGIIFSAQQPSILLLNEVLIIIIFAIIVVTPGSLLVRFGNMLRKGNQSKLIENYTKAFTQLKYFILFNFILTILYYIITILNIKFN